MDAFTVLESKVLPLPVNDIDTDQVIPARFLKGTDKVGLGQKLFFDWRYKEDGSDNPDFVLNAPDLQDAKVLLTGENFGCGSSREHAPWALTDWGFKAIIATSFADIFKNNALKNGLLPVVVSPEVHAELLAAVRENADVQVKIDLENEELTTPKGSKVGFETEPFARRCLLEGKDQLGYLLSHAEAVERYEQQRAW
ncbi:MAG: 3-isopropylmalate dehydratase small subunit [Myxococcota bacterium]